MGDDADLRRFDPYTHSVPLNTSQHSFIWLQSGSLHLWHRFSLIMYKHLYLFLFAARDKAGPEGCHNIDYLPARMRTPLLLPPHSSQGRAPESHALHL